QPEKPAPRLSTPRVLAPPTPRAAADAPAVVAPPAATATPAPLPQPLKPVVAAPPAETAPAAATAAPAASAPVAAASDANLILEVLPYAKLRAGGQMRRFQIQPRAAAAQRDPAALDALILQRVLTWLAAHRSTWSTQPTTFTVGLSIASLED